MAAIRKAGTHSIVATDRRAGEIGVAIQSHSFAIGSGSIWAEPAVGVVVAQGVVESSYGPLGLALMKGGKTPQQALKSLLATDPRPNIRQVAMIDGRGRVAVHTGAGCLPEAGHAAGRGFSAQATMAGTKRVWKACSLSFRRAQGSLSERLVTAIESGGEAGGDIGGPRSAALLIVKAQPSSTPWADKVLDLRVEDSVDPAKELRNLLKINEACKHATAAEGLFARGEVEKARHEYLRGISLDPKNSELRFWEAVNLINHGGLKDGKKKMAKLLREDQDWGMVLRALVARGLIKADRQELRELL